jgi:hypothetical protein
MSEIHTGPLKEASPDDEHHRGPLQPSVHPQAARKSWREQRWERRRRRRLFEEVVGWVVVPVVLVAGYWSVKAGLNAFGTTPTALIEGVKAVIASRS